MEKFSSKCSSCGYSYVFSPEKQALACPQCGSVCAINVPSAMAKKELTPESNVKRNSDASAVYECENCGAKTNVDESNVSGVCPYCGSTNLHSLADAIKFEPDAIVPFQISKSKAREKYKEWLKTRKFVPNKLKNSAKINKMEGCYFPCWNYDFNVQSAYHGVGVNHHTKTVYRNVNGQRVSHSETYETHHPFSGSRFDVFDNYLMSANSQISQNELTALGNFGLQTLKVYSPEFLLGFLSSGFSVDLQEGFKTAKEDAKLEIVSRIKREHSYDDYEKFSVRSVFNSVMWRYIYLPVWICNFNYQKKQYRFLVNGYSGYVTGKVPRSGWKIFGLVFGILLAIGAVVLLALKFS